MLNMLFFIKLIHSYYRNSKPFAIHPNENQTYLTLIQSNISKDNVKIELDGIYITYWYIVGLNRTESRAGRCMSSFAQHTRGFKNES